MEKDTPEGKSSSLFKVDIRLECKEHLKISAERKILNHMEIQPMSDARYAES
jgi:hypothetical protein